MKKFKLILLCLFLFAVFIFGDFIHDVFIISPSKSSAPIEIVIPEGATVTSISKQLKQLKIINHPTYFVWFAKWTHVTQKIKTGTFSFMPNTSIAGILFVLSSPSSTEVRVTIPEGFNAKQIKEQIIKVLPNIDQKEMDKYISGKSLFDFSENILSEIPSGYGLEGYLFPDTYQFSKNVSAKEVLEKMISTLQIRFVENKETIPSNLKFSNKMNLHEVLTLASIVEKEVQKPEDMKRVAGIFEKRLTMGMALQADSTLNYVTGGNQTSVKNLSVDSLFNTYRYRGLPPAPICNPGMNAILAVLHPIKTNALYFLTTSDGTVYYADSFAGHVKNKQKYLK